MMMHAELAKHVLDLSKATFDNVYLSVAALQQVAEDGMLNVAANAPWVPAEIEQVLLECVGLAQRTRGDLRDTVDRCHDLLRALVDRTLAGAAPAAEPGPHMVQEPVAVH